MKNIKSILVKIICCFLTLPVILFSTGCDMLYVIIPELCQHEWELTKVLEQPTCDEQGLGEYFCAICESEKEDIIESTGHDFEDFSSNASKHWKDCKNCTEKIEQGDHTFTNIDGKLKCSTCLYEYVETSGQIEFHFIMLGNEYAGDCIYIKAGEYDILIDAGSRKNSIDDIQNYLSKYLLDNKLEFVIVTHADQDHIAGFSKRDGSIFDLYECQTIIDFPLTNKKTDLYKGNAPDTTNNEVMLNSKNNINNNNDNIKSVNSENTPTLNESNLNNNQTNNNSNSAKTIIPTVEDIVAQEKNSATASNAKIPRLTSETDSGTSSFNEENISLTNDALIAPDRTFETDRTFVPSIAKDGFAFPDPFLRGRGRVPCA